MNGVSLRAEHLVLIEVRVEHAARPGVEPAVLEQRPRDAVEDAAVDLALHRERVDQPAALLHGDDLEHADDAGLGVDLHLRELHAAVAVGARALPVGRAARDRRDLVGRDRRARLLPRQRLARGRRRLDPAGDDRAAPLAATPSFAATAASSLVRASWAAWRTAGVMPTSVLLPPDAGPIGHRVSPIRTSMSSGRRPELLGERPSRARCACRCRCPSPTSGAAPSRRARCGPRTPSPCRRCGATSTCRRRCRS